LFNLVDDPDEKVDVVEKYENSKIKF